MKRLFTGVSVLCFLLLSFQPIFAIAEENKSTFSQAELDQMMAPIALYPDSLLSQILMASTYPADVNEAVEWSKNNPGQEGDKAVSAVQDKSWDPSVMSLVAFPQVLEMMGKQPDWVQNVGDAFLASPDTVMDTAQSLRRKAKDEGNLKDSKEQKIVVESTTPQTIIIEAADPKVIYVPVYNPTVVYGTWWWPAYRPYYYSPPGYYFGSAVVAGIGFGVGVAITNSLWGGCNWGRRDVDINVNRYNNINVNKNLNAKKNSVNWQHNSNNRRGVPYKDKNSRQKYNKKSIKSETRNNYRGRDADRQRAQQSLKKRGIDPKAERQNLSGKGGDKVRNQVNKIDRSQPKDRGNFKSAQSNRTRDRAKSMDSGKTHRNTSDLRSSSGNRQKSRTTAPKSTYKNNALSGARNTQSSSHNISRGKSSNRSMSNFKGSGGHRSGGGLRGRR